MRRACVALAALGALVCGAGLLDEPLLGDAVQLLDGGLWTATNNITSIPATVPGDLVTDMQRAGVIGDPLYERNFKGLSWEAEWSDAISFPTSGALAPAPSLARWLVLDSVKMGAWVWLNGRFLGAVADQFLRYEFDVSAMLQPTDNELLVTFPPSNHPLNDEARWIACSGAWDWAP